LADLEVVILDALLGGGDGARHELVLDRLALLHAEAIHDPLDALGAEDAEEVVLQRKVEPGRPGSSVAARAAAQWVGDPPGARRVATMWRPRVATTFSCSGSVIRRASTSAVCRASAGAVAGSRPFFLNSSLERKSGLPPSRMSVPRPAMLVAMVTAPWRPAWATISASRSWYLALSTSWRMPRFLRSDDSRSDFSIEMVPTSTG